MRSMLVLGPGPHSHKHGTTNGTPMKAQQRQRASKVQECLLCMSLQAIKSALGPLPFFQDEDDAGNGKDEKDKAKTKDGADAVTPISVQQTSHRPAVLADGSYASQTAITDTVTTSSLSSNAPNIR